MSVHRTNRPIPLGKRVATYRSAPPSLVTLGTWVGLTLLVTLQLAYLIGGTWACGPVGGVTLPAILWAAWRQQVPRRVDLYQNGFDYRVGRHHRYVFWNQIYEVYQTPLYSANRLLRRSAEPDSWMYRIVRRDGRSIRLYHLESIRTLGQRIQEQVARRHLPVALDAFRAGYSIRFGRHLAVSLEGLRFRRRIITWHEIAEISIDETNDLQLKQRHLPKRPRRLAVRRVPNLLLLDGILRASQEISASDSAAEPPRDAKWGGGDPAAQPGPKRLLPLVA